MDSMVQGHEWLVLINREDRRKMSTREVRAEVRAGTLARQTLVWRAGMNSWASIDSIAELAPAEGSSPAVPRGRPPGSHNRRFAETVASNHRIAEQIAALRASHRRRVARDVVATVAAVVLTFAATFYALHAAGVF